MTDAPDEKSTTSRVYFGGQPQSEIHQFLCDATDSFRACASKPVALALDKGVKVAPNFSYVSGKFDERHVVFQFQRHYFTDEQPGWNVGFDRDGNKYHGNVVKSTAPSGEKSVAVHEIRNLRHKAQPLFAILEKVQSDRLYMHMNRESEADGKISYYAWKGEEKSLVATFPDAESDRGFLGKDVDGVLSIDSVMVIPLHTGILLETLQTSTSLEKEIMSAQNKEQNTESTREKPRMFFAKVVADRLADRLRDGKAPTQRDNVQNVPYNPCTGRSYHGINALNLMMESRRDPRWMGFDEANNAGYKVKDGEKGIPIQKWPKKKPGEKQQMQTTWLFNADQLQFIPPMQKKPERPDPYERVSEILKNCGVTVVHDQKEKSFYNARNDEIHLPAPEKYKNLDNYCQDALNAYFHATGHPSRLNRDTFDSPKHYQQNTEELICAVSTTMMCAELGIPSDATKSPELATKWADNIEKYPIQFSQAMKASDDAVWRTMRQEQMRNIELNPHNNEAWRPVAEASPAVAVKTLLTQREVLELADREPAKVNVFDHDGVDVFTKPGTGYILSKTEIATPGQDGTTFALQVKTEGYDREGNTYDVVMEATVRKNDSGLTETVKPPEAKSINLSTREMALPLDWNGTVAVSPCHEDESSTLHRGHSEEYPEFYGAFAENDKGDVLLASFDREKQAQYYANLVERQMRYQQERPQEQQRQTANEQQATAERPQQQEQTESRDAKRNREVSSEKELSPEELEYLEQTEQLHGETRDQPEPKQDKEAARQEAKEKIAERLTEEAQDTEKAVARIAAMVEEKYTKPNEPTPYMKNKEVGLVPGVYQNGNTTCVPLYNTAGELRSMAYISEKGKTSIAKGTEGEAKKCAHFDKKAVEKAAVVTFAVGLANSATITQAHNDKSMAMVTAMKDADLPSLAVAFKQAYPDKQQVIFATNDHAYEKESGRNPGQYYAKQAAEKTGALVVSPRFAETETSKDFVNFNDLAVKSEYGKEAVKDQTEGTIEKAKQIAAEKAKAQTQEKSRSNKERARG